MPSPQSTEPVPFYDQDDEYRAWLNAHPRGFVLHSSGKKNLTKSGLRIHVASCDYARYGPANSKKVTTNAKVCHVDKSTLSNYAARTLGKYPDPCGICAP